MNKDTAILECKEGAFSIETSTPVKQYKFTWKKDESTQKWLCEVPMQLGYINERKVEVVTIQNLPQHLLNNYKFLRLFKHKKVAQLVQPEVEDVEDVAITKKGTKP